MLQANSTKNGTGIAIYGTYTELLMLYDTIHHFANTLSEHQHKSEAAQSKLLMNFAFEVRKAKDEQRLKDKFEFICDNTIHELLGFQLVWTDIIIFLNTLRHNAGYAQSDKLHQAVLYNLENAVEKALEEYDPKGAGAVKELLRFRLNITDEFAFLLYQAAHINFVKQKNGIKRFRDLPKLLNSYFSKREKGYTDTVAMFVVEASAQNTDVHEMEFNDFPEIVW